ncbi:hypothetical protein I3843_13G095800 [Carya illinoinensis]|uniref:FAS1 domain-containing protein n=1 Tax=Carya illinoinensis TaxID=32201 RepID=A0A8T1NP29_CARIL|nr:fasciclin-like arabinogalactan protein 12 [Carya illinoinensis]KAG2673854.1 hypothetical protein I3760_13G108600 [Carya illinoinensis]KAG6631728.1 hypothetical protein CIPAW_13G110200 [Carya illinoinensis]KAG6681827.1 hypothetical protein I3842_13G109300 [Carya illinoinensis]KAG7950115.1 hypothetical protein I3843_13G095800 [Carya illinoinensis]
MRKHAFLSLSLLLAFLCYCSTSTLGQPAQAPALPAVAPAKPADSPAKPADSPAKLADAPTPPGPPDVTKILQKAGGFTILIRLLKRTAVADQIKGQLNDTKNGFTLFAPTDAAFSSLKSGTLNSLSDEQKIRLIQFHTLTSFYTLENFQTVTNPLRTQAGDTNPGDYPLNVTSMGKQVNISTGLVNATVIGTVYSDNRLSIYKVDKVLLPLDIFVAKPPVPAPAPTPTKPKDDKNTAGSPKSSTTTTTTPTVVGSDAASLAEHGVMVSIGVSILIAAFSML